MITLIRTLALNGFIAHGDDQGIYGADWLAAKAARNEVRACSALLRAHVARLQIPLMAAVEAYGMACICTVRLPIGADTLVLGSADACRTVRCCDAEAEAAMACVGASLGLKRHRIVGVADGSEAAVHVGADVEVH